MRLKIKAWWVLFLATFGCGDLKKGQERVIYHSDQVESVPGSYIVAFKAKQNRFLTRKSYFREYQMHYLALSKLDKAEPGVKNFHYLTSLDLAGPKASEPMGVDLYKMELDHQQPANIVQVDFTSEKEARQVLQDWDERGLIYLAEPNYMSKTSQSSVNDFGGLATEFNSQIGSGQMPWYSAIRLVEAYQALDDEGVDFTNRPIVAVLDSGLDTSHPAFSDSIWENPDVGLVGCEQDVNGCNVTKAFKGSLGNGDVAPKEGIEAEEHGTHVAGLVAANLQEGGGSSYAGVCPVCRLMTVKITGKDYFGNGSDDKINDASIIAGLTYITRFKSEGSGANVIRLVNASFGKFVRSRIVETLVRQLASSGNGILVVAAAGNEDTMKRQYPAAFDDALAVVNMRLTEEETAIKAPTSNFGVWADIAAPGEHYVADGILSSIPGGGNGYKGGTSMAAPIVTGVAALVLMKEPGLSLPELKSRLTQASDGSIYIVENNQLFYQRIKGEPNKVPLLGSGMLNAYRAVTGERGDFVPLKSENRVLDFCGVLGSEPALPDWIAFSIVGAMPWLVRRRNES